MSTINLPRRIISFIRDLIQEALPAWGLARILDCERTGGHRWVTTDPLIDEPFYLTRTCTRCGCSRSTNQVVPDLDREYLDGAGPRDEPCSCGRRPDPGVRPDGYCYCCGDQWGPKR